MHIQGFWVQFEKSIVWVVPGCSPYIFVRWRFNEKSFVILSPYDDSLGGKTLEKSEPIEISSVKTSLLVKLLG